MREALLKIAGAVPSSPSAAPWRALAKNVGPLAAPFLILFCEPRWELAAVAACWSVLVLPGSLAINLFFPGEHSLGQGAGRFAVATVAGLLLFGLVSWTGCLMHWTLNTVLVLYAVLYVLCTGLLLSFLLRRRPVVGAVSDRDPARDLTHSYWTAAAVIAGIALMLVGVAWSTFELPPDRPGLDPYSTRAHWWHGCVLALTGSLIAAGAVVYGRRKRQPHKEKIATPARGAADRPNQTAEQVPTRALAVGTAVLLWLVAAALTIYVMKAAYALPQIDARRDPRNPGHAAYRTDAAAQRFAGARSSVWNSDDVTYVSEAVDYRYGHPLGRYEPTLGADVPMSPVNLSPLIAPLVAALSRLTGVECAALHHSMLCPLIVLLGASAMAAALSVVFRGHGLAVPLGLIVTMMMVCKSWDYERSMVEFTVWRAMQSKSVHLWLIHPLQLATLVLLATRPERRKLAAAIIVAVVGHLVHPFSTILGAVWCAAAVVVGAVSDRDSVGQASSLSITGRRPVSRETGRKPVLLLLALLGVYGLLGVVYRIQGRLLLPKAVDAAAWPSSGRVADEPEETRDLVREGDRPFSRQEPRILFGYDALFNFGAAAVPLILAVGLRRREWLYVGALGMAGVAFCNLAPLGRLLNFALPTAILWRARWMLPSLMAIAAVAVVLYETLSERLRRGTGILARAASPAASLAVLGAFAGMLAMTDSTLVRIGPAPRELTKFSADMHGLVELLGGREAAPFVWGTREVTRELPQFMPNIKLVLSREKIMRPAANPDFRDIVLGIRDKFRNEQVTAAELTLLGQLYPIDHIVIDQPFKHIHKAVGILRELGWLEVGTSGHYRVWRRESKG